MRSQGELCMIRNIANLVEIDVRASAECVNHQVVGLFAEVLDLDKPPPRYIIMFW